MTRIEAALRADPGNLQVGARYRLLAIQNHEPRQTYHVRTFITLEDLIEATLDANKRQDTSLGELLGKESQEE